MIGTAIEWATDTINFWWGCTKVSEACRFCYAERVDGRLGPHLSGVDGEYHWGPGAPRLLQVEKALRELGKIRRRAANGSAVCQECGHTRINTSTNGRTLFCGKCSGMVKIIRERPRVFINSMSDFFEDRRDLDEVRLMALDAMRQAPEVDFLLLTKRPEKILELLRRALQQETDARGVTELHDWLANCAIGSPAPRNIWLGTTVENQEAADQRIPELLKVPAAVRFLSCEPLLGPVDLWAFLKGPIRDAALAALDSPPMPGIDWVICGGESGPSARPMHPDWARALRDQCAEAGVPFFFKQWGEWLTYREGGDGLLWPSWMQGHWSKGEDLVVEAADATGRSWNYPIGHDIARRRVGKKAAGRLLDGQEHSAFPEPRP